MINTALFTRSEYRPGWTAAQDPDWIAVGGAVVVSHVQGGRFAPCALVILAVLSCSRPEAKGQIDADSSLEVGAPPDGDAPEAVVDGLADAGEDDGCRSACEAAVSDAIPCGDRAMVISDCVQRCGAIVAGVSATCGDCIRSSVSYTPRDATECTFGPAVAFVGLTGACALSSCDTILPCYGTGGGGTCAPISHCVQPCGPMQGSDGVCAFPQSGTCSCQGGAPTDDACANDAACICPSCGDGEGVCVTPPQKTSLCFPSYAADSPQAQAQVRFDCPLAM
jgi:hypothetical protein